MTDIDLAVRNLAYIHGYVDRALTMVDEDPDFTDSLWQFNVLRDALVTVSEKAAEVFPHLEVSFLDEE